MSNARKIAAVVALLALGAGAWVWSQASGDGPPGDATSEASTAGGGPVVHVMKSPTCGCCSDWVDYMREEGFRVETEDMGSQELVAAKNEHGVPRDLFACHTATVEGYVVEGHVPAREVRRLLEEKPDVTGIAVPEMPAGSPGMEVGGRQEPYDVVAFDAEDGERSVFASY